MRKVAEKKNLLVKFVDEFLRVIRIIFNNIFILNPAELIKFLIKIIIIFATVWIMKIPFNFIMELGNSAFIFLFSPLNNIIITIWTLIINLTYIIFAMVLLVYLFDKTFEKEKLTKSKRADYEEVFTDLYQTFIYVISLPFFLILVVLVILFLLSLYFLTIGIPYYSLIIIISALLILDINIIYVIFQYLKQQKQNTKMIVKPIFSIFGVLLLFGVALLITEVKNTKFYQGIIPSMDYEVKNQTLETNIDSKMKIICNNCFKNYDIIYDNTLNNKIIIEVSYYDEFVQTTFESNKNAIIISGRQLNILNSNIKETIINDLKKQELHDFYLLYKQRLTIWIAETNSDNLEIIVR